LIETWIDETERRTWFLSEIQVGVFNHFCEIDISRP